MTADERIDELLARAGQPVMVVKGDQPSTSQEHLSRIEKRAKQMAKELRSPKYECTIAIMCDEIVRQDAQIRNMADTIDRLEEPCRTCLADKERPGFEWHGVQEVKQHGERVD